MTEEDIELEKKRVALLSDYQKTLELRIIDAQLKRMHTLRAINVGELNTLRGKYKALARDYGLAFTVYYGVMWMSMFGVTYASINFFGFDATMVLQNVDARMGWSLADNVNPELGNIGLALVTNELLEVVRLPFVVFTVKPVVDRFTNSN